MNILDNEENLVSSSDINPMVKKYLLDKMNADGYQQAQKQMLEQQAGNKLAHLAAGIGDALAGKDSSGTDRFFAGRDAVIADQTVGEFNRKKAMAQSDKQYQREQEAYDPNSTASQSFRRIVEGTLPKIVQAYGKDWSKVTAADKDNILSYGKMQYGNELRRDLANKNALLKEQQLTDRAQSLQTPYGTANNVTDAKDLKDAYISRQNFDAKLQEMIDLRKKYGSEVMDREAVARGKQLSKDLLLEYKNMAKLGVLSKADEDIINAIIPDNPLAFQASNLAGQDPILTKLESFKNDNARAIDARIKARTREGTKELNQIPKTVTPIEAIAPKKASPISDGRITVTNGKETFKVLPEDLQDALKDGFQEVANE